MAKAIWNGTVLAESETFEEVEGNVYFPPDSLRREHFRDNPRTTNCFWKGKASYYDVVVDGNVNEGAAWTYANPLEKAANIRDHVAFWKGVEVTR